MTGCGAGAGGRCSLKQDGSFDSWSHRASGQRGESAASCLKLWLCCFAFQVQGGMVDNLIPKQRLASIFYALLSSLFGFFMIQLIFVGLLL